MKVWKEKVDKKKRIVSEGRVVHLMITKQKISGDIKTTEE